MLCIFNPEHDLCLANGHRHFVAPSSALDFARRSASLMQILYPEARSCCAADAAPDNGPVVPWGWNLVLKTQLLKQGFPSNALPSDSTLDRWRNLQHRSTWLSLQPDCRAVTSADGVEEMLSRHHAVVLKAPWSGSGRGLRWVTGSLSDHDRLWLQKIVREQRCVIVEPRRQIACTFAIEYRIAQQQLQFVGYSLFESANGVYRGNLLLPDAAIAARVGLPDAQRKELDCWLQTTLVPAYEGPLGVDFILTPGGTHHLTEINLRHTMGLLAHEYLRQHPDREGGYFTENIIFM